MLKWICGLTRYYITRNFGKQGNLELTTIKVKIKVHCFRLLGHLNKRPGSCTLWITEMVLVHGARWWRPKNSPLNKDEWSNQTQRMGWDCNDDDHDGGGGGGDDCNNKHRFFSCEKKKMSYINVFFFNNSNGLSFIIYLSLYIIQNWHLLSFSLWRNISFKCLMYHQNATCNCNWIVWLWYGLTEIRIIVDRL